VSRAVSRIKLASYIGSVCGLFLFAVFTFLFGTEGFRELGHISFPILLLILAATFCSSLCISLRWGLLANSIAGYKVARGSEFFRYFTACQVLGLVLPRDVTDITGGAKLLSRFH